MNTHIYHGGAFFDAVGDEFDRLAAKEDVISADVLDAWFDPAPSVLDALRRNLSWIARTSPPTSGSGLQRAIARARGVPVESILAGAGSSDLIFLALREWVKPGARVLILDPMYGEYAHVLENVIGCTPHRHALARANRYAVRCQVLAKELERGYDWVVLVNPNSPTGQYVPSGRLEAVLRAAPSTTRFWIDETYIDFVEGAESLERFASASNNVVVCKSMSKAYALSGARCAYLCGAEQLIDELRLISPPWSVSLAAQIAACEALRGESYYQARWAETHVLRGRLAAGLRSLGWEVVPGCANFLLCHVPDWQPTAAAIISACRTQKLFLRDVSDMGRCFDDRVLRVAVKDAATIDRMLAMLKDTLRTLADDETAEYGGYPAVLRG